MQYLLDTHTLIWTMPEPEKLSQKLSEVLSNRRNKIFVSVVSFWEIAIKIAIGKLDEEKCSVEAFVKQCKKCGFKILKIEPKNTISYLNLPLFQNHRDPFDRMLISTAIERNFVLLNRDIKLPQYDKSGLLHIL